MEMHCYCIDLDAGKPEVLEFFGKELADDLEFFGVKTPAELETYDRKIFLDEIEAENYLEEYLKVLKGLDNAKICVSRELPAMLYKRRYIVQTLMGSKMYTCRDYFKKNWRVGDLINLHDQTFFLTVKLTAITPLDDGGYRYDFKLGA